MCFRRPQNRKLVSNGREADVVNPKKEIFLAMTHGDRVQQRNITTKRKIYEQKRKRKIRKEKHIGKELFNRREKLNDKENYGYGELYELRAAYQKFSYKNVLIVSICLRV